ncbi:MAG: type II toxin-antitoxin system RelE/ParE family toxin [Clostridia bacterium]|nr:type II toxin-antitoxin system RelE/ParE family toxin [Clostridia bacterium]
MWMLRRRKRGDGPLRKVFMYSTEDKRVPIKEFLSSADKKVQRKFDFMLKYIKTENILCEPYVKHFSIEKYKMLYELRLKAAGSMVRIIYYVAGENIILLHAFYKRDRKDTEHALEYALKLLNTFDESVLEPFEYLAEV